MNFPTKDGYRSADNLKQWAQKYARPYVNTLLKHLNTVHEQENCFEFDDFIRMAASYYSRQAKKEYSCVFVDEVQDMSATDSSLLECFHSMSEKLVLVGDTDQSIYRFRGADIQSVLKKVASSWGDISTASLTKNFRCRKEIVGASDVVANAQASRQGMHVEHCSAVDGSGEVNLVRIKAANYEDFCDSQSKYVARLCKELPGSTAILANKMKMSKNLVIRSSIEQELKNNNITYGVATGKLQTELLSLASCLWKSVVTNDRLSLEVCLSTINGVGVIKSKKLAAAVLGGSRLGISLPTALAFLEAWDALRDAYDNAGEEYSNFVKNFSATFLNLIATSTLRLDSDCLQYAQCLLPDIQKCAQQAVSGNGDAWTENILDETTVCSGDKPEVILSTIHSAKGLEFDNVIVVNAFAEVKSAGWLCGYCVFGNDADEEMRKLYVAITRAKQSVTVITAAPDDAIGLPVLQNICWDSTESVNDEEDVG